MLCHPSLSSVRPRTAPWGHQLRRKNISIARKIATTMPWSTPRATTPRVATSDSSSDDFRTSAYPRSAARFVSESAAAITTPASAAAGGPRAAS